MSAREKAMEDPNPSTENGFPAKNSNNFESLWIPTSSSVFFTDSSSGFDTEKKIDGESDVGRPEKKRRLKPDQVRVLEEIFEVENKLESCRKQQLAEELGLHPRQIAIWFQNRRARCKSKVLEKEYDALKAKYDKLKADHDSIFAKNQQLRNQVHQLTQKLGERRIGVEHITAEEETFTPDPPTKTSSPAAAASSVKSDVIDSDSSSPSLFDKSEYLKPDFSDENMSFLQPLLSFPKIEGENCEDLQPNSCNLGFPVQHQGTWLWRY